MTADKEQIKKKLYIGQIIRGTKEMDILMLSFVKSILMKLMMKILNH